MQDNLLEMWQSFQAQHGTISNLRKIVPTEPLTRKDLLAVIQYPLDFSENEAVISAENVQDQEIKIFLASEKIKISLDIEKINQLKDLIESDKFFEQPKNIFLMDLIDELPLYALPLYITQRIHNNYLNDLLLIWSSHHGKDFRILQYAYVLDENGRLSIPFQALHLEVFAPRFLYFDIWKLKVDEVMQLLKDCGDRGLFYISTLGRYATPNVTKDLGSFLVERSKVIAKIPYGGEEALLHVGMTTYEILNMVVHRANAAKLLFRVGNVLEEEIEVGINERLRIGSIGYCGVELALAEEGYAQTDWAFSTHDKLHNQFLCNMPPFFVRITRLMVQVLRKAFQCTWSKEIWALSELDFATYSKDRKIQKELEVIIAAKFPTSQQIARFLYHLLLTTNHVNLFYHQEDCGIKPKPAAFFILLDMIENKQKWFELGLNPDDLEGYFAETYNAIRDCYEYIKNDPAVLRFAKFKVINEIINNEEGKKFSFLFTPVEVSDTKVSLSFRINESKVEKNKKLEIEKFIAMVEKQKTEIVKEFKFEKGKDRYRDDMIYLSFRGSSFSAFLFRIALKMEEDSIQSLKDTSLDEGHLKQGVPSLGESNRNEN